MARRIVTQLVDDITGEDIADGKGESVTFALDSVWYSIDLTNDNAAELRDLFQNYIGVAARVGKKTGQPGKRTTSVNTGEVRAWARSHGFPDLGNRGRIPEDVQKAWDAR